MAKIAKDYYLTEVDILPDSIYCMHDLMGEDGIRPHQHVKDQLLYTEGGLVHVKIQDVTYFLPARHYMWIPAGLEHSIHPGSNAVTMRNLYFPKTQSDEGFSAQAGIYPVNELLLQMLVFTRQWDGDILPEREREAAFGFVSALRLILPQLSQNQLLLMLPIPTDKRLAQVIHYMEEFMQEGVLLPQLAQRFGFSERSLSRLFKSNIRMSFVQYHTIQRMLKALRLLLDHKMEIKEVATLVGYNSIPTFSATFRKVMGSSPSAYAKRRLKFKTRFGII
ncbi:MAG: AraC family transcriptional regulator [Pedobacter sp.]|uniref:AraC family transcriptional regulator n=1 Tax=Pedobacter sp. TaxID=1411316 RepID=UPI00280835B2|nr:AraC family transcriptional regulator [Pedobacter sp.]MDQ8004719.1 AraC family transcriptional regulator [Pedobacter sp.]